MPRPRGPGIYGPYPHRGRWRLIVRPAGGEATTQSFATEAEAARVKRAYLRDLAVEERTVDTALDDYERFLADEKKNKAGSVRETLRRLRQFFGAHLDEPIVELTPMRARACYEAMTRAKATRPAPGGVRVETDRTLSVDTCRNTLAEARTFLRYVVERRWLTRNPLDGVKAVGKRQHGKAQLRLDEARAWIDKALALAAEGDTGAVAALCTVLLGMRASEITTRAVRDLDDDGRLLWIPTAKTEAGRRTLEIPDVLRPHLLRLAQDRPGDELLFGSHWRDWPRECVQRICDAAGVPRVTAHGMRGLHSTAAISAGATAHVVAAALGHESPTTTLTSYADSATVEATRQRAALKVLRGGKGR